MLQIGVITGAIALVGASIVVYAVLHTVMASSVRQTGVSPGVITSAGVVTLPVLAVLAVLDVVVAFVAGALMLSVRYCQIRHAHA